MAAYHRRTVWRRDVVTQFNEVLLSNGPILIELCGHIDGSYINGSYILEKILENQVPQDHILAVKLDHCTFSLTFLQYLNNLVHLDLSKCNLHGKLDVLGSKDRGLVFINMYECHLTNSDLKPH